MHHYYFLILQFRFLYLLFILCLSIVNTSKAQNFTNSEERNKEEYWNNFRVFLDSISYEEDLAFQSSVFEFLEKLESRKARFKNHKRFISYIYLKARYKFLKEYQENSTMQDLFKAKRYDCVIGTSFFALLLDYFGYKYQIRATNYHTFLLVTLDDGDRVMIESTDPVYGIYTSQKHILFRIKDILQKAAKLENGHNRILGSSIRAILNMEELSALPHYNKAIELFNTKQYDLALVEIDKAFRRYPASRFQEFQHLIKKIYRP